MKQVVCCVILLLALGIPTSAFAGGGTCPTGFHYIASGTSVEGQVGPSNAGSIKLTDGGKLVEWQTKAPYKVFGIYAFRATGPYASDSFASEFFKPYVTRGKMPLKEAPAIVEACLFAQNAQVKRENPYWQYMAAAFAVLAISGFGLFFWNWTKGRNVYHR